MTEPNPAPPVSEPDAPTDHRRPRKWLATQRLGLKKRYLLLVAAILLTAIPIISWVAWHELNLPQNLVAVLPPSASPPEPAVSPAVPQQPAPVPLEPVPDAVPAAAASPAPPDDARMVRLEELLERNTELLEQIARDLEVNEDAHLYLSEKIDLIEDMKASGEAVSAMVYDIAMQVDSLSPYAAAETATAAAEPTVQSSPASPPPFELLAIDKWQHDWYAVLELDGNVAMVTPPDSRAGWELVRLDPTARKALFRNTASGTEHELQVR